MAAAGMPPALFISGGGRSKGEAEALFREWTEGGFRPGFLSEAGRAGLAGGGMLWRADGGTRSWAPWRELETARLAVSRGGGWPDAGQRTRPGGPGMM